MCELFSISTAKKIHVNEYLKEFYKHCELHPHGWGLALMQDQKTIIQKQPKKASESLKLKKILSKPIHAKSVIAHIRLATQGNRSDCNCHPFIEKDNKNSTWTLIHNGTIFNYPQLDKYKSQQKGVTDSERILLYILDSINNTKEDEYFNVLNNTITKLSENNKLNIILHNKNVMYIHTNCIKGLNYLKNKNGIIFSTKKLNDDKNWKQLPINTLYAVSDGKIIQKGKTHKNEYHLKKQDLKFMLNKVAPNLKDAIIRNFNIENPEEYI